MAETGIFGSIEDVEDLLADLDQALGKAARA